MIVRRCADRLSSDCRETGPGSGSNAESMPRLRWELKLCSALGHPGLAPDFFTSRMIGSTLAAWRSALALLAA